MAEISIPQLIRNAAQARGIDPDVALRIAERESSLDPTAKNKRSSAYGLFQVTDDTWKQYKGDPAKRRDLAENLRVGLDVISSNRDTFIKQFGREPAPGELYTMHFLGRTGGPKLLRADPSLPVSEVLSPRVLKANPDIKNKTVGEFIASMQQKMGSKVAPAPVARTEAPVPMPASPRETMQRPQRPRIEPLAEGPMDRAMLASLGPNYQAALAAMTLGDSRDDEDEESFAEQYAARQEEEARNAEEVPRSAALANLDLSYQSPFAEPVQQFRDGGIVRRANGSPVYGEMADTGPITADTRAAFANRQGFSAAELMRMLKGVGREGVSNLESLARGSVSAVPGLVGDVESLFRTNKERKFATTPEVERQYLPKRMTAPTKESAGFTEMGTFIDPTIAGRVARPVAQGTAKAMLAGVKAAGPQIEATLGKMAPAAAPMNIVRPSGGLFPSSKTYTEAPLSNLDELIQKTVKWQNLVEDTSPERAAALKFLDTKVRNYFRTEAGSVSDRVREALIDGRIKIPKDTELEEMYPTALINAARAGDVTAMRQLERQFDKDLSIKSTKVGFEEAPEGSTITDEIVATRQGFKQNILEQMKRNPQLIPDEMLLRLTKKDVGKLTSTQAKDKVAEIRQKLAANPTLFNTVFEEKIMRMMADSPTDYIKPSAFEKFPSLYGNLKNALSQQEGIMALKEGAPFTDVEGTPKILGQTFKDITTYAQMIPPAELERMDVPEVINRVIQLRKANDGVEPMAKKAESLVSAGKPVPDNISTFGTKVVIPADDKGFVWREIVDPAATKVQAKMLGNSIAGYAMPGTYGKLERGASALISGDVRLFGLYDKNNQLMTNVEYITSTAKGRPIDKGDVAPNSITQFFGNGPKTGNVAPSDFGPQVVSLVNFLNPTSIPPTIRGILKEQGAFFPAAF